MDYITNDVKRDLMNRFNKGDIVKHKNVEGERFVIEVFDNVGLLVGIRRLRDCRLLWVDPECIIVVMNGTDEKISENKEKNTCNSMPINIKKVIFNNPATIVFWSDDSKTVVKANLDDYDPEKGLAMAIAKKALGNEGNYYNVFKKWLPKNDETIEIDQTNIGELFCDKKTNDILNKALEDIKKNIKTSIPSSWDGNFIYSNIRGLLENDKY